MGFFSDLKEDLNQAVNELLPGGEKTKDDEVNDTMKELEELEETLRGIDEMQEEMAARAAEEAAAPKAPDEPAEVAANEPEEYVQATFAEVEGELKISVEEPYAKAAEKPKAEEAPKAEPAAPAAGEKAAKAETPASASEEKASGGETIMKAEEMTKAPATKEKISEMKASAPVTEEGTSGAGKTMADVLAFEEKKELRAAKVAPEGEKKVDEYSNGAAIKSGEDVIDKSWVLDLRSMEQMEETAVITAGMRVKGDILSNGSADIFGEVYGNVQVKGKLNVTGKIVGNSKGEEILADAAKINGDVLSDGAVKIGVGTVIVGNVEATDAIIAGAVKGTIDVKGPVVIDATAVVLGNIRAKSVQINNGARIEGMCVLCYAEQSAAKFFEEQEQ